MCFNSQRCRTNSQIATLSGNVRDRHTQMVRKRYLPFFSPLPLKLWYAITMAFLNLQEEIYVFHVFLLGSISSYSWRCLFTLVTYICQSKNLFRFQHKFPLVKFCSKGRTAFHFIAMVGADVVHFGGLHSSAKLICLKQKRVAATLPLVEAMLHWWNTSASGNGTAWATWLTLKIWLRDWVSNRDDL